jgi:tetratricopeptide (TPR) repeat protein
LSRDPQSHLSPDELAGLAEETESTWRVAGADPDRDQAKAHAEGCGVCGPRLRDHRSVQARLRSMVSPVASTRKSDCPAEERWATLAAGLSSAIEAKPLLEHVSRCDYCGQLLRAATEDLNPEISAEEEESIRQLPSASAAWQRALARKMTSASAIVAGETLATPVGETELRRTTKRETRTSVASAVGWPFARWTRWAIPFGAAAALAVGAGLAMKYSSPSLSSTNKMIAQAYTEQRPFELRFPGAGYGPVRQERGESGPSHSRMDEPAELLEAETQIARGLARHPQDAGWLQAKARADLIEGHYQDAIEALEKAEDARPEDTSIKIDLATAYFERAGAEPNPTQQAADCAQALQSLNNVLSKNPNDLIARFNRASVYERQKKYAEAIADWQRYLQLDPSGQWAESARKQLRQLPRTD